MRVTAPELSLGGEALEHDLLSQGYSLINHGIDAEQVDNLIVAYANFTDNLPDPPSNVLSNMLPPGRHTDVLATQLDELDRYRDRAPEWHKYRTNHPYYAKPGGYSNRSEAIHALYRERGVQLADDPKEFYHFDPTGLDQIMDQHDQFDWGPLPPEVIALHDRFAEIHTLARQAITEAFSAIEDTDPQRLDAGLTPADIAYSQMRLVFYHPGPNNLLAAGHYDKSVGTMQVAESHLGLRLVDPQLSSESWPGAPIDDPRMRLLQRSAEKGAFFLGSLSKVLYPNPDLSPAWHDVINHPEVNDKRQLHGDHVARWALIFFANSERLAVPNKADTHSEDMFPKQRSLAIH